MTFKEYSFRELLINIVDNRGRTCPTSEHGIPLIATNCIKNSGLYPIYEKLRYVSEETYQTWFRGHPEPGDMIFVCKGSPGRVCWTPDPVPFCIAQDMVAIRADTTKVYPKYLFALLRSEAVQHQILNMHVGTLIPHFKKGDFANLYLQIPEDMEYQRRVGDAYFSFCESIEKNHQINQTLEQMAQAIFKSWFVDFEPVKAKIAALEAGGSEEDALLAAMQAISGKGEAELTRLQAEQPEQYAELRATAELFPSAMQDSELGEIPEGWEVTDLKSSTIEIRRGISPKYTEEGGIQVINQKCIRNHKVDFSLARRNDTSKRKIDGREIQIGDVLVNSTGVGTLGRLAPVRHLPEPSVADSHITVIRANNRLISNAFLAGLMITSEPLIEASGAGSTGQTELRKQVLEEIVFARPSLKLSRAYEGAVEPMGQQMACIERQLVSLASTRDVILPKLLSGDLSVPNKGNQPKAEPLSPLQGVE